MYRDPKVKMQKDQGLRNGVRSAIAGLVVLGLIEVVALYLYF